MDTQYIHVAHTDWRGRAIKTELRVESSEGWTGMLDVGIYGYNSGDDLMLLSLDREQVEQLREACAKFLAEESG